MADKELTYREQLGRKWELRLVPLRKKVFWQISFLAYDLGTVEKRKGSVNLNGNFLLHILLARSTIK